MLTGTGGKSSVGRIGRLNERPLHAALREWVSRPGDRFESPVEGFLADIDRDGVLIEIQTAHFGAIREKLDRLLGGRLVVLVYPIAAEKWIVKMGGDLGAAVSRRKSPKRGRLVDVFAELVGIRDLLAHPGLSIEVVLTREEEVRYFDPDGHWRTRGWGRLERRLVDVVSVHRLAGAADLAALLPEGMGEPFDTAELAHAIGRPRRLAQQMVYCLRALGAIEVVGKRANARLYRRGVLEKEVVHV